MPIDWFEWTQCLAQDIVESGFIGSGAASKNTNRCRELRFEDLTGSRLYAAQLAADAKVGVPPIRACTWAHSRSLSAMTSVLLFTPSPLTIRF